jgi:hypothetical protein
MQVEQQYARALLQHQNDAQPPPRVGALEVWQLLVSFNRKAERCTLQNDAMQRVIDRSNHGCGRPRVYPDETYAARRKRT